MGFLCRILDREYIQTFQTKVNNAQNYQDDDGGTKSSRESMIPAVKMMKFRSKNFDPNRAIICVWKMLSFAAKIFAKPTSIRFNDKSAMFQNCQYEDLCVKSSRTASIPAATITKFHPQKCISEIR